MMMMARVECLIMSSDDEFCHVYDLLLIVAEFLGHKYVRLYDEEQTRYLYPRIDKLYNNRYDSLCPLRCVHLSHYVSIFYLRARAPCN